MKWINPWKRAAQLERENQRLRDCLEHEEQRNFDYMFHRMEQERQRHAHIIAQNEALLKNAVAIKSMEPLTFVVERNGHEGE
jgi:cell shape-determining protein MreC